MKNQFTRDIQEDLKAWKSDTSHKVLQLEGPRQIGKTTELLKFGYSNYENVIYVNISKDRSKFIEKVIDGGMHILAMDRYCREANMPRYVDNKNTILIIDEIQASLEAYNSIRDLYDSFRCDIIVTGSYLGQILKKGYFQPAGTIEYIQMFPLSFKEFCRIFKADKLLEEISLYGESDKLEYEKLDALYNIYRQIGGYPEVIKAFIKTKDINACYKAIEKLLRAFENESRAYFEDGRETMIFETIYIEAIKEMCSEKRNTGNKYIDTVLKIANKSRIQKTIVSREEVLRAVEWLVYSGVIGRSHLYMNGDKTDMIASRRTYYIDCGIANYIAYTAKLASSDTEGLLTETFAYSELYRLCKKAIDKKVVNELLPCFSVYGDYELDFMMLDRGNRAYGIEVKTNRGDPKSLKVYIEKKLIDRGIVAKKTQGGRGEKFDTIPIYTIGERFPYN